MPLWPSAGLRSRHACNSQKVSPVDWDTGSEGFALLAGRLEAIVVRFWNEAIEKAAKKAEEYLENKYHPPNAVPLWIRGEREAVQKVVDAIRTLKKEPHQPVER